MCREQTLLMVWVLLWKVIQTLWHTVPKPILQLVNRALQFLQDLDDEFGVTGKPRYRLVFVCLSVTQLSLGFQL